MPAATRMKPKEGMTEEEMSEGGADDTREGSEGSGDSGDSSPRGRKKGMAPPFGKKGKKPCSCKGAKKACDCEKRGDSALTAPEYLAACDLGIQGRSRSYIRARLDTQSREDVNCKVGKACGGYCIPKEHKCTGGTRVANRAVKGAAVGILAATAGSTALGALAGHQTGTGVGRGALIGFSTSPQLRGAAIGATIGAGATLARLAVEKHKRKSKKRKDNIYADGFVPDMAELNITSVQGAL